MRAVSVSISVIWGRVFDVSPQKSNCLHEKSVTTVMVMVVMVVVTVMVDVPVTDIGAF